MEISRTGLHQTNNLENDQLEHGQRQRKGYAEHQLNQNIPNFVIAEQMIDEEPPTASEEAHLQKKRP